MKIGRYNLIDVLGQGGMAEVWRARHLDFQGDAALKLVSKKVATSATYLNAFAAEARSHAGLVHPNIAQLFDYGQVGPDDQGPKGTEVGRHYLVMEMADATLRDRLPLASFGTFLAAMLQILDALAYAHARGVIHRDIKPENILVFGEEPDTVFKLTDFGIAHDRSDHDNFEGLESAASAGTPLYMAPEQLRGRWREFGPETDLYALGCAAMEMITGYPPFQHSRLIDLAMAHINESPPIAKATYFDMPDAVSAWVFKLLAKRAEHRFESAAQAAQTLWKIVSESGMVVSRMKTENPAEHNPTMTTVLDLESVGGWLTTADHSPIDVAQTAVDMPVLLHVVKPPFPPAWRSQVSVKQEHPMAGLGLFALRRLPFPGLEETRTRLWDALGETYETKGIQVVVGRAEAKAPVRPLGEWLLERAHETGVAASLRAFHSIADTASDSLRELLVQALHLWNLDGARLEEALKAALPKKAEARVVQLLMAELSTTDEHTLAATSYERFEAAALVIGHKYKGRPLILWLENAEHAGELLSFVEFLIERPTALEVMVLITFDPELLEPDSFAAHAVGAILAQECTTHLSIENYDGGELAQLLNAALRLSEPTQNRLLNLLHRDVVYARILLGHLIRRGRLLLGPNGFDLDDGPLPNEPIAFFEDVVKDLLDQMPNNARQSAQRVFEIAATLGDAPNPDELRKTCALAGIEDFNTAIEALEDEALVAPIGNRWSFAHKELRQLFLRQAAESGNAGRWHQCIADVLSREDSQSEKLARRIAWHRIQADQLAEAVPALLRAIRRIGRDNLVLGRRIYNQAWQIVEALGLAMDAPLRLELEAVGALLDLHAGEPQKALSRATAAQTLAQSSGAGEVVARCLHVAGYAAMDLGQFGKGFEDLRRGAELLEQIGDIDLAASCAFGAGYCAYSDAQFDACLQEYGRSATLYQQDGNLARCALVNSYIASVHIAQDDLEAARSFATKALELAQLTGDREAIAEAASDLAEIARFRGDLVEARAKYRETLHWYQKAGTREAGVARINLALVDIGERRFQPALDALRGLSADYLASNVADRAAFHDVCEFTCLYGLGSPTKPWLELEAELKDINLRDIAWVLEVLADEAAARADDQLRGSVLDCAGDIYERLGASGSALRVQAARTTSG